ncbi:MAG TPA: glycosyltransferase family 39 protein [Hymenobacter sp.]|uniref:ArnT family glycosyltransferase n=1 Tax=Hymenobacter sp. TaxID=1898978 RepID=UPI002D7E6285|nr:glycosyltransferase family 39 protein [Hymenobacter sp.]HET9506202.1 glycosyltransferase family 39 protein [Hymenobacter sp.]
MSWFAGLQQWLSRPNNQLLALLVLAAFPLYYELGRNPVQLWDESRLAVNAAEMARDGHWLVPHFDGSPDHWNTKPPLLIWLEALSFKAFGYSTWALRLPTLVATLTTIFLLFRFAANSLGRPLAGFFAGILLVTCTGYVRLHVARTADYDALLTCWQVVLWTTFFEYLETGQRRHLTWAAIALIAATFTKGPAGLLGLPGLAAYALIRGKLGWLLRQPSTYVAAGSWLVLAGGYLILRERLDPGYIQAMRANDAGGRFLTVIEGHSSSWTYYLNNLAESLFTQWLWAVIPALLLCWLQPAARVRWAGALLALFIAGWLAVISTAQSKLAWYDAPIYPALALVVGLGMSLLYQDLGTLYLPKVGRLKGWFLQGALFVSLFYGGYYTITHQLVEERHSDFGQGPDGHLGRYVDKISKEEAGLSDISILTEGGVYPVLQYYKIQFEDQHGRHLTMTNNRDVRNAPIGAGRVVVVCDPAYRVPLDSAFKIMELHQDFPCQTLLLLPR